jgi:hypothetical protein
VGEEKILKLTLIFLHCSTRTSNFKSYFDANAGFTNSQLTGFVRANNIANQGYQNG